MDITPAVSAEQTVIESYGAGRFQVGGETFDGSILVFPNRVQAWPVRDMAELSLDSLAPVLAAGGETGILLLGCGPRLALVPAGVRAGLRAQGIVVEPMDTGAACRTYNVLMAEGRPVAAALIAIA